jgi:hypothetical protein
MESKKEKQGVSRSITLPIFEAQFSTRVLEFSIPGFQNF